MQKCEPSIDWRQMNLIVSPVAERWKRCGVDWKMESMGESFGWMWWANDSQKHLLCSWARPQLSVPDEFGIVRHEYELQWLGLQKPHLLHLSCTHPAFLLYCMSYSGARWLHCYAASSKHHLDIFSSLWVLVVVITGSCWQALRRTVRCQVSGCICSSVCIYWCIWFFLNAKSQLQNQTHACTCNHISYTLHQASV